MFFSFLFSEKDNDEDVRRFLSLVYLFPSVVSWKSKLLEGTHVVSWPRPVCQPRGRLFM